MCGVGAGKISQTPVEAGLNCVGQEQTKNLNPHRSLVKTGCL